MLIKNFMSYPLADVIEYRNLITGEPVAPSPDFTSDYFELNLFKAGPYCYQFGTSEGEFLSAWASQPSFKEAWFDALTYTTVGGTAYQAWESRPMPADPGTEPDSPVYQGEGFDPYAGNLDQLLGY